MRLSFGNAALFLAAAFTWLSTGVTPSAKLVIV
jgi:hypothetical protein